MALPRRPRVRARPAVQSGVRGMWMPISLTRNLVFVLAGQSNMVGNATLLAGDTDPVAGVYMLDSTDTFVAAKHPIHFYPPPITGNLYGPGLDAVKTIIAARSGTTPYLVPAGYGGTGFRTVTGDGTWNKGQTQYDECVRRTKVALNLGYALGAVLWHQGESDADNAGNAAAYETNLRTFIANLRADIGIAPFLIGELAPTLSMARFPNQAAVRAAHVAVAADTAHTSLVSASGLSIVDTAHFNRASYITLGQRYGAAYLGMT